MRHFHAWLRLLSHNFSNVMINSTSLNEAHYYILLMLYILLIAVLDQYMSHPTSVNLHWSIHDFILYYYPLDICS
jgi:hypothetical protein